MSKDNCSVVFTGDIGFDRFMAEKWKDEELLSKPLLDFFHSADHVVANVEGALIKAEDDGSHASSSSSSPFASTRFARMIFQFSGCIVFTAGPIANPVPIRPPPPNPNKNASGRSPSRSRFDQSVRS